MVDHLAPIARALPPERRGSFFVGSVRLSAYPPSLPRPQIEAQRRRVVEKARAVGLPVVELQDWGSVREEVLVAALPNDEQAVRHLFRKTALLEHGTGQTYRDGARPVCPGGPVDGAVGLFLCTNERVAAASRARFPAVRAVVTGSPRLDALLELPKRPRGEPPVVAFSFHWDNFSLPETRGAFSHYRGAFPALAKSRGFRLLGHSHPQLTHRLELEAFFRGLGVGFAPEFEQVAREADLYVADSSSTSYEFAALDRPVVLLDAPWYRRNVEHGLRFWEFADLGVRIGEPALLERAIEDALADTEPRRARRREITDLLYPNRGRAAALAVEAILELADS